MIFIDLIITDFDGSNIFVSTLLLHYAAFVQLFVVVRCEVYQTSSLLCFEALILVRPVGGTNVPYQLVTKLTTPLCKQELSILDLTGRIKRGP